MYSFSIKLIFNVVSETPHWNITLCKVDYMIPLNTKFGERLKSLFIQSSLNRKFVQIIGQSVKYIEEVWLVSTHDKVYLDNQEEYT